MHIFPENSAAAGWKAPYFLDKEDMNVICFTICVILYIYSQFTHIVLIWSLYLIYAVCQDLFLLNLHLNIYFLFWGNNANGITFFILISEHLLLVYRYTANFVCLSSTLWLHWTEYFQMFLVFFLDSSGFSL